MDGVQIAWPLRSLPQFPAQPREVDIHRPVGAAVRQTPDMCEQVPPGDYLPRVESQVVEQLELAPAQVEYRSVERDLMGASVEPKAANLKWLPGPGAARLGPSQDCLDPGLDLVRAEWLDHVVVRSRIQRPDDLGLIVARGDHQHRHRADRTDHAQCFLPAEVGQPKIEQHGIGRRLEDLLQRGHCRGCAGYYMTAFRQGAGQRVPDGNIVLYQQQLNHNKTVTGVSNAVKGNRLK